MTQPTLRQQALRAIKTKRAIRVRDYGFQTLVNRYATDIYSATYTPEQIELATAALYANYSAGASKQSITNVSILYGITDKKLLRLMKKIDVRLSDAMNQGSEKITDKLGQKLTLQKPEYSVQIKALRQDNLKYVKNITDDQRQKLLDVIEKGFKDGKSYKDISNIAANSIKSLTKQRALLIAETEMNRAISQSMIETLKYNNINYYNYLTARDNRVSDICNINSYGNKRGTGKLIRHKTGQGPIPVKNSHPRCRCVIIAAE